MCPGSGTQWPYVLTKAEAVEEEEEIDVNQPPPESLTRKRRSRGSKQVQEELIGSSQGQPSSQTSRRPKLETSPAVEVDNNGAGPSTRRTTRTSARLHR